MKLLSKREKILLYALAVLAIVAGLVLLVIRPAQLRADELDAQLLDAKTESDAMRMLIAQVEGIRRDVADYNAEIEVEAESFLPVMNSDELDEYITGLLQTHGLVAQALAISADSGQSENDMVQTYQVNVVARGTISQIVALAETVKSTDGIRIAALSLSQMQTAAPTSTPRPTATPKPKKNKKQTPTPEPTVTPAPTPYDPAYLIDMAFVVIEYNEEGDLMDAVDEPTPAPEETPAV